MSVQVFGRLSYLGSQTSQIFFFFGRVVFSSLWILNWLAAESSKCQCQHNRKHLEWGCPGVASWPNPVLHCAGAEEHKRTKLMLQGLACWAPHPAWAEAARAWAPSGFSSAVARVEGTWLIPPGSHPRGKRASVFSSHGLFLGCSHKSLN